MRRGHPGRCGTGGLAHDIPPHHPPFFFFRRPGEALASLWHTTLLFCVVCASVRCCFTPPATPLSFGEAQFVAYYPIGKCPIEKYE